VGLDVVEELVKESDKRESREARKATMIVEGVFL
jgi:hypothetical protein